MCSPNTIPGFPPVSGFSQEERAWGNISQTAMWHHCCIWRTMNWQRTFTLTNCVWKHFTFGWQWSLTSGTNRDKASRPLMVSGGSLYRKPYFRTRTSFMGMSWLILMNFGPGKILFSCPGLPVVISKSSIDLVPYYCFSCFPLTTGKRLWVGAVCVCDWVLIEVANVSPPPPLLTHPLLVGLTRKNNPNANQALQQ